MFCSNDSCPLIISIKDAMEYNRKLKIKHRQNKYLTATPKSIPKIESMIPIVKQNKFQYFQCVKCEYQRGGVVAKVAYSQQYQS